MFMEALGKQKKFEQMIYMERLGMGILHKGIKKVMLLFELKLLLGQKSSQL